jgi:hypothetical protein
MCNFEWICWCASTSAMFIAHWPKLVFRSSLNIISNSNGLINSMQKLQKSVLFFSLLFINLLLLPNSSHAFRVPYRYPTYPLFHKELIQNTPAGPAPNEVVSVELFPRDNAKAHHTNNYEIVDNANPALVVRRGDPFYLAIRLNGAYDQNRDKIRLEFMFGARPQIGKGTLIYLPISNNKDFTKDSSKWDARTQHIDGQTLTVHVHIPSNVAVGVWRLRVSTKQ